MIHVDIDPAEVGKNRVPDIPIVGDVKRVLQKLNKVVEELEPEFKPKQSAARANGGLASASGRMSIPTIAPAPKAKSNRSI